MAVAVQPRAETRSAIDAAAAALPSWSALPAAERGAILEELVEKSDLFASTLVARGTFGFMPRRPGYMVRP